MPRYLRDVAKEQKCYRVFRLEHLASDMNGGQLTLVAPSLWADPFEDLPTWTGFSRPGDKQTFGVEGPRVFGQCWSLEEESDAHWRLFGGVASDIVKVRATTTVERLLAMLKSGLSGDATSIIGKVVYTPNDMKQAVADVAGQLGERAFAEPKQRANFLLAKRAGFSSEREVRLLVFPDSAVEGSMLRIPFQPNEVFEELMVGPQIALGNVPSIESQLRASGFANPVSRSELYQKVLLDIWLPDREVPDE